MAAEPALEPTTAREEEQEESDDGEESDVYEVEGEEEGDVYEPEEDEEDEGGKEAGGVGPENMTALLLGKQNGTGAEEYEQEDDEEDEEYHENVSGVAGSKRGVDELSEGDASGDEDEDAVEVEEKPAKKARV